MATFNTVSKVGITGTVIFLQIPKRGGENSHISFLRINQYKGPELECAQCVLEIAKARVVGQC